jgi:transposase
MKQYPADFRDRLLRAIDAGLARAEAARLFGVSERTLQRWQRRRRETGSPAPAPRPGRPPRLGGITASVLIAHLRATPDATLAAHCDRWAAATGVRVSPATMSRAVRRLDWTLKKSRCGPPSGTRGGAPRGGPRPLPWTPPP